MYQTFIGLEIHIHLNTCSKVFCSCTAQFGDEPNTHICPVCMGLPGALPALNIEAIRKGYAVAKALGCTLTEHSVFERKNYFYPDMPKNYQISQFGEPLGRNGLVEIVVNDRTIPVRIHEIHLEEDAGKMIHAGDFSLLDYNRAGYSLLEIVTEPDLSHPEEAEILLHELRRLVRAMGVSDGNMEEGSLRCDANISLNTPGAGLGRKVEIKNLNSSRFVRKALQYEIQRQSVLLDRGEIIRQETRLWNENRDQTEAMRSKESANDYRYFPEPDLPVFHADAEFLASLEDMQVELPSRRRLRLQNEHGLSKAQAEFVCDESTTANFYEAVVASGIKGSVVASWLSTDVQRCLNHHGTILAESPLTVPRMVELLKALEAGRIHSTMARTVLEKVFERKQDPEVIIKDEGLELVKDSAALEEAVAKVLGEEAKAVSTWKSGDQKVFGYLLGKVMRATGGTMSPQDAGSALRAALEA